jgi:hypothetical protein
MPNRIWTRIAAAGGIFYVGLTALGNDVLGSGGEGPDMTASRSQIGAYVSTHPPTALSWAALYIELLGILAFVFFLGCLWSVLRRAEGEYGPFSAIAFGAGLVSVGVKIASFPAVIAAFYRAQEGMDSQLAAALLDMNGVSFVLTWAIDAALLAATAVVVLSTGALPRWLGWSAAVLSPALLVGVAFATSFGFVPYVLTTLWIVATSIVFDPPCRRAPFGRKRHTARANHVGPLGALI